MVVIHHFHAPPQGGKNGGKARVAIIFRSVEIIVQHSLSFETALSHALDSPLMEDLRRN
jgi:hypothetical protein